MIVEEIETKYSDTLECSGARDGAGFSDPGPIPADVEAVAAGPCCSLGL